MADVSPVLLENVQKTFDRLYRDNKTIQKLYGKVRDGTLTYPEANNYAQLLGDILAESFDRNLSSAVLPNGKMYYNIAKAVIEPSMLNNYEMLKPAIETAQRIVNAEAGVQLNPIIPDVNQSRINGIIDTVSREDVYDDVKFMVGSQNMTNFSESIIDNAIRMNADAQFNAGLTPTITRIYHQRGSHHCAWCANLAGTYEYPVDNNDIYRRHRGCHCTIEYHVGRFRQNVHSKKWYTQDGEALNARKVANIDRTSLSWREAQALSSVLDTETKEKDRAVRAALIKDYMEKYNVSHHNAAWNVTRNLNLGR
jgi:hypothetical protein